MRANKQQAEQEKITGDGITKYQMRLMRPSAVTAYLGSLLLPIPPFKNDAFLVLQMSFMASSSTGN